MSSAGRGFALVALLCCALLISSFVLVGPTARAADEPKYVKGYVRDSVGNLLSGADVTVNMRDGSTNTTIRTVKTDVTDSNGYYSVTFLNAQWEFNDIIEVMADFQGHQKLNWSLAKELNSPPFTQWVNVTYPYEIPEYGSSSLGLLVMGASVAAVATAILVVFRKKQ